MKQLTNQYIEDKLRAYYKEENKTIRDKSIKVYVSNIKNIYSMMGREYQYDELNFFYDIKGITKTFRFRYSSINTLMTKVSSLIVWLRANDFRSNYIEQYTQLLFEMDKEKKIFQKSKIKNEKLKMNILKMKNIKYFLKNNFQKIENIPKSEKERKAVQRWLIFNLYSGDYIAPVRSDYNCMKIVDTYTDELSMDYNYYSKTEKKFIFCNYKTCNKKGITKVDIPDELNDLLLKVIPMISNDYLIIDKKGLCMDSNRFSKIVATTFDGATICDLRKYYLTNKFKKLKQVLDELTEITRCMMNSSSVALTHYISEYVEDIPKSVCQSPLS